MKALITGATGFIGSHLADALLQKGFSVTCLVRDVTNLRFLDGPNVKLVQGDCSEEKSLSGAVREMDYVFHLAGLTKSCSEADFVKANVTGAGNMIKAVLRENPGIKRFVHLSSLAAAGPTGKGDMLKEECGPGPVSVYGRTKLEGEKIVFAHKDKLPVTIIRPPVVYGPRDRDLLVFFKMVKSGFAPYWGRCHYSFLYVEDLINGIILSALNDKAAGEIFFMSDGNIYTTDNILGAISEAVQKVPVRINIPGFVMPLLGRLSERLKGVNIINADKIREMKYSRWTCDTSKAVTTIGFQPKVGIKEGARWTADWYRIHRWL